MPAATVGGAYRERFEVFAQFAKVPAEPCQESAGAGGKCRWIVCEIAGSPQMLLKAAAGTITVRGGLVPVAFTPALDFTYRPFTQGVALFRGGETLTATAAGGIIAPFELSLVAPSPAVIREPLLADGAFEVDRARDL